MAATCALFTAGPATAQEATADAPPGISDLGGGSESVAAADPGLASRLGNPRPELSLDRPDAGRGEYFVDNPGAWRRADAPPEYGVPGAVPAGPIPPPPPAHTASSVPMEIARPPVDTPARKDHEVLRLVLQPVAGTVGALGGAVTLGLVASCLADDGDVACANDSFVHGATAGLAIGSAVSVWAVGTWTGGNGGIGWTALGGGIGALTSVGLATASDDVNPGLLLFPVIGSMLAYGLSHDREDDAREQAPTGSFHASVTPTPDGVAAQVGGTF